MASDFTWNPRFFEELGRSAAVAGAVQGVADQIANAARSSAPRDSGEYASSITTEKVSHRDRDVVHVVAKAPHSMFVEAKHGTLARAAARFKG